MWELIGRGADIISILAMWGFGKESAWWVKLLVSIFLIALFLVSWGFRKSDRIRLKDYATDNESGKVVSVLVRDRQKLEADMLLSLYVWEGNSPKLIGIGNVIDLFNDRLVQVDLVCPIDKEKIEEMKNNQTNIKKYFLKPGVRYGYVRDYFPTDKGASNG